MNFNKAIVVGRLTQDPEKRTIPESGTSVTNFSIATNRYYKDRSGQNQEETEFHDIVLFGNLADVATNYLKKGALALIEGRLQTRSWEAKDGTRKYRTEIVGESLQLGPRAGEGGGRGNFGNEKNSGSQESNEQSGQDTQAQGDQSKDIPVIDEDEDEINVEDIPF